MKDAAQQPTKTRRGGIPKGQHCAGCGGRSTGVHLDHELVPPRDEPLSECLSCGETFSRPKEDECPVCGNKGAIRDHSSWPCSFPDETNREAWCRMHLADHPKGTS